MISSTYEMRLTSDLTLGALFERDYPGEATYYWVEGMGLVKEIHVDTGTGATILAKEMTSSSGL